MSTTQRKLAFVLFKYFPYGGLQRDFMQIAKIAMDKGDSVDVYTLEWHGEKPVGMNVNVVEVSAMSNHVKYEKFFTIIQASLKQQQYDCVIGFNKIPGLDVYFAADPCYEARVRRLRGFWVRWTNRYRHFSAYERTVFSADSKTEILLIVDDEIEKFKQFYQTPESRMHILPPGIQRDRLRSNEHETIATALRKEIGVTAEQKIVLMVGSGFRTKGLDRSLEAIASLPKEIRNTVRLVVIGKDNIKPFIRMAEKLGIADCLQFFAGRDDIPRFLMAADILIHPAYSENAGIVLLEALAAGLPVLTTDICGYAHYVNEAKGGVLLASPFSQTALNKQLEKMLSDKAAREQWSKQGNSWAKKEDIYDLHQHAYDIISSIADKNKVSSGIGVA